MQTLQSTTSKRPHCAATLKEITNKRSLKEIHDPTSVFCAIKYLGTISKGQLISKGLFLPKNEQKISAPVG